MKSQPVAVAMTVCLMLGRSHAARLNTILKVPGDIGMHQGLSIACQFHLKSEIVQFLTHLGTLEYLSVL